MTRGPGGVRRLPLRTVLCLSAEHCSGREQQQLS